MKKGLLPILLIGGAAAFLFGRGSGTAQTVSKLDYTLGLPKFKFGFPNLKVLIPVTVSNPTRGSINISSFRSNVYYNSKSNFLGRADVPLGVVIGPGAMKDFNLELNLFSIMAALKVGEFTAGLFKFITTGNSSGLGSILVSGILTAKTIAGNVDLSVNKTLQIKDYIPDLQPLFKAVGDVIKAVPQQNSGGGGTTPPVDIYASENQYQYNALIV